VCDPPAEKKQKENAETERIKKEDIWKIYTKRYGEIERDIDIQECNHGLDNKTVDRKSSKRHYSRIFAQCMVSRHTTRRN
jgi:hypothetical protein